MSEEDGFEFGADAEEALDRIEEASERVYGAPEGTDELPTGPEMDREIGLANTNNRFGDLNFDENGRLLSVGLERSMVESLLSTTDELGNNSPEPGLHVVEGADELIIEDDGNAGLTILTTEGPNGPEERLRIDGNGNVGIGTGHIGIGSHAPSAMLDVRGSGSSRIMFGNEQSDGVMQYNAEGDEIRMVAGEGMEPELQQRNDQIKKEEAEKEARRIAEFKKPYNRFSKIRKKKDD